MKVIILAGGSGSRLWPLSRESYPKQFIKLAGQSTSLFQETIKRSLLLASLEDIYIVTNREYRFLVVRAIEELSYDFKKTNILLEPEAKNTLSAIYAGVNEIIKLGHDDVIVFPSDHILEDIDLFVNLIQSAKDLAKRYIITFGIKPTHPNTGYGYIASGEEVSPGYIVKAFKEKPNLEDAKRYIEEGYDWNAGIFMFSSKIFKQEVKKHASDVFEAFETSSTINDAYQSIYSNVSIDYGLMEKSQQVAVVKAPIVWNDLGSFEALYDVLDKDSNNNIARKEHLLINTKNTLIQAPKNKLIAVIGLEDLVVIDTEDALLISKKNQTQQVKTVVEALKERGDLRTECGYINYRPWGFYSVLEEEQDSYLIKRITINPGKIICDQLHPHQLEHLVIVKGIAKVTIESKTIFIHSGESIFFNEGQDYRLENPRKVPLEIISIQKGLKLRVS